MLKYLAFQAITWLSSTLPCGAQYWVAKRLADIHYALDKKGRRAVRANVRVILGPEASEAQVGRESRWVFRSFGMYLCEFFGYRRFGPRFLDEHVRVEGREHLDRALAGGRGCLFVSGHYSNWELGASVVGHLGYPILIVAQMHPSPRVNELFIRQRARHGVTVAHTEHGARATLKGLRENRPVAILGDRPTGGPTVSVTLFGRPTALPLGPWRIALNTGAPILPTFVHRRFHGAYTLEIGAPLHWPESGSRDARIAALAQDWAQLLEARVRADPCQWACFYAIWPEQEERVARQEREQGRLQGRNTADSTQAARLRSAPDPEEET